MSSSLMQPMRSIPLAAALLCALAACNATPSQDEMLKNADTIADPAGAPPADGVNAKNKQISGDPAASPPVTSSTTPSSQDEQLENVEMIEDPAGAPSDAQSCDAAKAQSAVGKTATQDVVDKIVADSGARSARVIKPGMAVTMDYREDRVNIDVDAANTVTAIRCG